MALLIPQGLLNLQLAIFHSFSDLKYERKLSVETNDRLQLCSSGLAANVPSPSLSSSLEAEAARSRRSQLQMCF